MKRSSATSSTRRTKGITLILLALCGLALVSALIIGINDNPPGLLLLFIAASVLILAFVHPWRRAKNFLILLGASVIGFALFVVLHNVFYMLGQMAADVPVVGWLLRGLSVLSFFLAIIGCPAAFLVGLVGSIAMYGKKKLIP